MNSGNSHEDQEYTADTDVFISQVVENLYRLGMNWQADRDFDSAEVVYKLILELRSMNTEVKCPEVVLACGNLADILAAQCKSMEAEHYHIQAVSMSAALFGPRHPSSAISLRNYGEFLRSLGLTAEADRVSAQAQEIFSESYHRLVSTLPVAETMDPHDQAEILLFGFDKQRARRLRPDVMTEYNAG